jgi:carboxymethylenebutenolidase
LEIAVVVIIAFEEGKMKSEQIYWDQASVLVQLGLLDPRLPVAGAEVGRKALDPAACRLTC